MYLMTLFLKQFLRYTMLTPKEDLMKISTREKCKASSYNETTHIQTNHLSLVALYGSIFYIIIGSWYEV